MLYLYVINVYKFFATKNKYFDSSSSSIIYKLIYCSLQVNNIDNKTLLILAHNKTVTLYIITSIVVRRLQKYTDLHYNFNSYAF